MTSALQITYERHEQVSIFLKMGIIYHRYAKLSLTAEKAQTNKTKTSYPQPTMINAMQSKHICTEHSPGHAPANTPPGNK